MSLRDCIVNMRNEGVMSANEADETLDMFEDLVEQYSKDMGSDAAEALAAKKVFDAKKYQKAEKKRQKLLQVKRWEAITDFLESYRDRKGEINYDKAAKALFEQDEFSGATGWVSVMQRKNAVEKAATQKMSEILATFSRNTVGVARNKAKMQNVVREAFGENTGDLSAKELAEAWKQTAEYLRLRRNASGGSTGKIEDYGFPQLHDAASVRKVSFAEWREFIEPRLDVRQMIDESTNQPFSPEGLRNALESVYNAIRTEGYSQLTPSGIPKGRSMANRRTDSRFLKFKNADAWMEYQGKFGSSTTFDTMIGHIDTMAREIALMEVLGPNPSATINFVKQTVEQHYQLAGKPEKARPASKAVDNLYAAVTGTTNVPINGFWANTLAGTRQILQSAQLGAASLAAITDINFQRMTRGANGMRQTKLLQQYLKEFMLTPSKERAKLALRLGLTAEGYSAIAAAQMRFVGDISGPEITRRISDFVMRASLLSPITQAGRWSFGMEFLGMLADYSGKTFDELPFKKTLQRYGFTPDDWDVIRATPLHEEKGVNFLRPADIEARTDLTPEAARELSTRVMSMLDTETNFAVPSTSVRGRTAIMGDLPPGTIMGELARSTLMYKNFAITLHNTHIMRGMAQQGAKAKGIYYADFAISTMLMGALALQLKEISKGRDPRPMTSTEFWGAAMLQGGGLGVFGDFLYSSQNQYGGGPLETVAGPVLGVSRDLWYLTAGNAMQMMSGKDTNMASEAVNFASRYFPGTSIFYTRLPVERMIWDRMKDWTDPKRHSKVRRLENKYRRETGQSYWWRPGRTTPSRPPSLESAIKKSPK